MATLSFSLLISLTKTLFQTIQPNGTRRDRVSISSIYFSLQNTSYRFAETDYRALIQAMFWSAILSHSTIPSKHCHICRDNGPTHTGNAGPAYSMPPLQVPAHFVLQKLSAVSQCPDVIFIEAMLFSVHKTSRILIVCI